MTDENADATFTFSLAGQAAEGEEPEQRMEGLRKDMQKVWKPVVLRDYNSRQNDDYPRLINQHLENMGCDIMQP